MFRLARPIARAAPVRADMPTIDDADRTFDNFEALLQRYNVEIRVGSRLESALLFARKILDVRRGEEPPEIADDRPLFREMCGLFDLARRVVAASRAMPSKFESLVPALDLFCSDGQLSQSAPTPPRDDRQNDQDADRLFELLVAVCLLPRISQLVIDRGSGTNPDLLFRFSSGSGSRTWGIACKRLYSTTSARYRDTVRKAIDQIEKSPAEHGLVFVSLVNLVRHDVFYPLNDGGEYTGFSRGHMIELLEQEQRRIGGTVGLDAAFFETEFANKKAMPGVVNYIATTYLTGSPEAPIDKVVQRAWSSGRRNQLRDIFQKALNHPASFARHRK
jgi:hypothetical protein